MAFHGSSDIALKFIDRVFSELDLLQVEKRHVVIVVDAEQARLPHEKPAKGYQGVHLAGEYLRPEI